MQLLLLLLLIVWKYWIYDAALLANIKTTCQHHGPPFRKRSCATAVPLEHYMGRCAGEVLSAVALALCHCMLSLHL
jgi:hypothetical protein